MFFFLESLPCYFSDKGRTLNNKSIQKGDFSFEYVVTFLVYHEIWT
jgi:hypothetical protein